LQTDLRFVRFKVRRKLTETGVRILLWALKHERNRLVNAVASRVSDGYSAFHYFHEEIRVWKKDMDSKAMAPVDLTITLNKDTIVGGHYDKKDGLIDYNPAAWLWWTKQWLNSLRPPPGIIDDTEFAFRTTCYTLDHTLIHEILHKFVEAQNTDIPEWMREFLDNAPIDENLANDAKCLSRDYEESAVQSLTDDLFGPWDQMLTLLLTELLVASDESRF
jgi:hypothetical protein